MGKLTKHSKISSIQAVRISKDTKEKNFKNMG
jgi:hypothetical protein